ncbi:MAG: transposase [Hyphomonadaceae bacterium]|nr:transposase [Hyphomonadaceae bacterium]
MQRVCRCHGIEHRFTKPNDPWTNGRVERAKRIFKEASVRRYHQESHAQLQAHLAAFLEPYNFAKRLKANVSLTRYERVYAVWTKGADRFNLDRTRLTAGLNT